MPVANVQTRDTHIDLTDLLNAAGERWSFDPVGFLAGLIAESNLDEHSFRHGNWPDVSFGLSHVAVKWAGLEIEGLERAPDRTALDTPQNRAIVRDYLWDAARSIAYTAPKYARLLAQWGDPVSAWCRWNKPNLDPALNPNRPNYVRALARAEAYRAPEPPPTPEPEAPQEEPTMPTLEEEIVQLKAQQALQTKALRRLVEGKLEGADGAAGAIVALEGGQTSIEVGLGKG